VYVVIGGAGGIGEVFSAYLIEQYEARVIWIGRRVLDESIRQKLDRVSTARGRAQYVQAVARSREQLQAAYEQIRAEHGPIHGVIHSALVLSDQSVGRMSEERFAQALQAKVDVSVRLWEVFGREGLDFVLFFSSLQSYTKAAGQSNYAAGCTFSDAYAQWLSERSGGCAIKVMNWGYWGGVGIVASAEYRQRMQQQGIGSIEPAEGMQGLEQLLQGEWPQVSLMKRRVVAGSVLPQWPETIRRAPSRVPRWKLLECA
jgi:NAD(P)-dependent dehydrogenase (short-subunit alcohol dehydrogenase family)